MTQRLHFFKKIGLAVFLSIMTLPSFAQQLQCPGSTKFDNVGDSVAQVVSQCGQPPRTEQIKHELVEWHYSFIAFYGHSYGFSLLFDNQVLKNIALGMGHAKTTISCPNGHISIGNKMAQVVSACGHPHSTKNLSPSQYGRAQPPKIMHLIYQPQSYLSETTFIFKNGKLTGSK